MTKLASGHMGEKNKLHCRAARQEPFTMNRRRGNDLAKFQDRNGDDAPRGEGFGPLSLIDFGAAEVKEPRLLFYTRGQLVASA